MSNRKEKSRRSHKTSHRSKKYKQKYKPRKPHRNPHIKTTSNSYKKHKKHKKHRSRSRLDRPNKINPSRFPPGFKTKVIHNNPYIIKIRRLLDTEEIDTLLSMAKGHFEKSTIVVDGEMVFSNVRTSETAYITVSGHYEEYPEPVERLLNKICYLAGCKRYQIEGLMVVKYGNGEEYYNHHDYFRSEHTDIIAEGGQRISTFFCYLTSLDKDEGGETEFPLIRVKIKPSKGTGVFWWNTDTSGKVLNKTLHRGNPVKSDKIKYGLNVWIREYGW